MAVTPSRSRGRAAQRAARSFVARQIVLPAQHFVHTETVGAGVLLAAAVVALGWANSPWAHFYQQLWEKTYLGFDLGFVQVEENLRHWVNDGLMVIFFFVVGLEVKRELVHGALSNWKRAALPLVAALGGMAVPAVIYLGFTAGTPAVSGWGIPMATDIAFALGVLAIAGKGIPFAARIFLLALAAVDDIGAILVIAVFYSEEISLPALGIAAALVGVLVLMNQLGVRDIKFYLFAGLGVWLAVFESGVHATIAGVVLGLLTPSVPLYSVSTFADSLNELMPRFRNRIESEEKEDAEALLGQFEELVVETEAPLDRRMRLTHPWSSFFVLPLFALANAGVEISGAGIGAAFASPVALGVMAGLVAGKLLGIVGFSYVAVKLGLGSLPGGMNWRHMAGVALTAGIGFTVSLFITELAFIDMALVQDAKVGILLASAAAGALGLAALRAGARHPQHRP